MFPLSQAALLEFFKGEEFEAEIQQETKQVVFPVRAKKLEFPTFVRIIDQGPLLQLVTFIPTQYTAKTVGDLARLLHLLNKEVDLPGFGMDETTGTIFYRRVIPCLNKEADPEVLKATLGVIKLVAENLAQAIQAVAAGAATFDELLKRAEAEAKK